MNKNIYELILQTIEKGHITHKQIVNEPDHKNYAYHVYSNKHMNKELLKLIGDHTNQEYGFTDSYTIYVNGELLVQYENDKPSGLTTHGEQVYAIMAAAEKKHKVQEMPYNGLSPIDFKAKRFLEEFVESKTPVK